MNQNYAKMDKLKKGNKFNIMWWKINKQQSTIRVSN
jgi:hypothetical protein